MTIHPLRKAVNAVVDWLTRPARRLASTAAGAPRQYALQSVVEALGDRIHPDTPASFGLSEWDFATSHTDLISSWNPIAGGVDTTINQQWMANPFGGTLPDVTDPNAPPTPFHVRWTGTISIGVNAGDPAAGTYYVSLPNADGAMLSFDSESPDGQTAISSAGWFGDVNHDGVVDGNDIGQIIGYGFMNDSTGGHTWEQGDFDGDGVVDGNDIGYIIGQGYFNSGIYITPRTLDNTGNDPNGNNGALTVGAYLSAGTHQFQLDYWWFNPSSSADLHWSTSPDNLANAALFNSGTSITPYIKPRVAATANSVAAGQDFNGVVARFSASDSRTGASGYSAAVSWGSGSGQSIVGTITGNPFNGFAVSANIPADQLPSSGSLAYAVSVTHTASTFSGTGSGSIAINTTPLQLTLVPIHPMEGRPFNGLLGTFTGTAGDSYSGTIDWGQANGGNPPDDAIITAGPTAGTFRISGQNTYWAAGSFAASVTVTDNTTGQSDTGTDLTDVSGSLLSAMGNQNIKGIEGQGFSGDVATFTDTNPHAGGYKATVTWLDSGVAEKASVRQIQAGKFAVSTSHQFKEEGIVLCSVVITTGPRMVFATGTAKVKDAPLSVDSTPNAITADGELGNWQVQDDQVLATFGDNDPNGQTSDYTATIHWGDGAISDGTIQQVQGQQKWEVTGTHTYTTPFDGGDNPGGYWVSIEDAGMTRAIAVGTVDTNDADEDPNSSDADDSSTPPSYTPPSDPPPDNHYPGGDPNDPNAGGDPGPGAPPPGSDPGPFGTGSSPGGYPGGGSPPPSNTGGSGDGGGSDDSLTGAGEQTGAVEGGPLDGGVVAIFDDSTASFAADDYTVSATYRALSGGSYTDQALPVHVEQTDSGSFQVVIDSGTSAPDEGRDLVKVDIAAPDGRSMTVAGELQIDDAYLSAQGVDGVNVPAGQPATRTVATFSDGNKQATTADFTATIDWGNGVSSAGTVVDDGNGGFKVLGTCTYDSSTTPYLATVDIQDDGGAGAKAQTAIATDPESFKVTSETVDFTNSQAIAKDDWSGNYEGPQWIAGADGVPTDHASPFHPGQGFPVSYVRSTPGHDSKINLHVVLGASSSDGGQLPDGQYSVIGVAFGTTGFFQVWSGDATDNGSSLTADLSGNKALPDAIDSEDVKIDWYVTRTAPDGTEEAVAAPSSKDHLYVTGSVQADGQFETVIDVGCRDANGLKPSDTDPTSTDNQAVLDAIWKNFATNNVLAVDGKTAMQYFHDNGSGFTTARLVRDKKGRCQAWSSFLVDVLASQGVAAQRVAIVPPQTPAPPESGLPVVIVPDALAQGDGNKPYHTWGLGLFEVGGHAVSLFNSHAVVETPVRAGYVYDPSYGVEEGDGIHEAGLTGRQVWEDWHLVGTGFLSGAFLFPHLHISGVLQASWSNF